MPQFQDAAYWHFRAEEARAIGDEMGDPGARETMYHLATNWERMARRLEVQERARAPRRIPHGLSPAT